MAYIVSSGQVSSGIFLNNYNSMTVLNSGTANNTVINSNGRLQVNKGGIANSTTVNSSGWLVVESGGTATNVVWTPCVGGVYAYDGAIVTFVNEYSGVYYGKYHQLLSNAMSMTSINLENENCSIYVMSGGIVSNTMVNGNGLYRGAYMYISKDGTAINTTLNGSMFVSSNGTASGVVVNSFGNLIICSGGTATDIVWTPCVGHVYVSDGGHATFVSSYSGVYYGSRNTLKANAESMSAVTIGNSAEMNVMANGTIDNVTVSGSGALFVSSGGVANNTNVNNGGSMWVSSDGLENKGRVNNGGQLFVERNGTANSTTVNNGGNLYVSRGGTATNAIVNGGGRLTIYSGGTAVDVVENGGYVNIENGECVTFSVNSFSGLNLSNTSATVHSGTTANSTTVNSGGKLFVYSGGTAVDVIENGGYVDVADGANVVFAANTVTGLISGTSATVHSGTIADNMTIHAYGSLFVFNKGVANSTLVYSSGGLAVSSGGTANNTIIYSSGFLRVLSGGTAAHVDANTGALLDLTIAPDTYIEGIFTDSAFEIKEGSATYYTVNSGNKLHVSSGGVASRIYVYGGGDFYVSSGGTANRTVISGGIMTVRFEGIADSTTINYGGKMIISNGGTGNAIIINNEAGLYVSSGGIADFVTVNNNGWLYVSSGGTATNITASSTRLCFDVSPDTYIAGTVAGFDFEIKDGVASDYTVNSAGELNILSGGTADNVTVNMSGHIAIYSGGVANNTIICGRNYSSCGITVSEGGIANNTTINSSGCVWVFSGGSVNDTTINKGGRMWVYTGAKASNTTINAWGSMWASSGGTATDLRINSGGYLYVEHAKLTGKITIADGGTIQAGQGAVIDFDISRLAPNMGALLNNLSLIKNDAPAFTLTVSDLQWNGTYKLAQGVTEFDNLISVKSTANQTIHMVAVDETANVDGIEYTLKLTGDTLSVTVTGGIDIPVIPVSADITDPTRTPVNVTADFSDAAIMREYSFDNDTWHVYTEPVTFRQNGTVYFLGKDQRGFINEVASYDVTNIDLMPPENPTASADITDPTNTNVVVTAAFSEDAKLKEYSLDGKTWLVYTDALVFEQNGTVYFRATDALGNESEVVSYSVANIDKTPPAAPTAKANTTNPTNQPVKVSASFSNDSAKREYSLDGENWSDYSSAIQFAENGTVYFRALDAVGNVSEITTFEVTNIDTTKPDKPTASADVTELTNTDVLVTAEFSEDSTKKEYSLDGYSWRTYSGTVRLTGNGTVYFRGTDAAGNVSEVESYTVDYIDKSAPNRPTAYADVTNITNGNVFVSAVYSEDSIAYEYSFDNKQWLEYTDAVMFAENGTVYFRGADEAGNYSGVTKYVVSNIDKTAPTKPTAHADVTEITSGDVTVSAVFSNDSAVKEYSLDGRTWKPYTEAIKFVKNGNIYFRSFDAAGNVSEVAGFTVNNIIKAAPEKPTISVDVTSPTSGTVTVSAVFGDELTINQYSLDGETWLDYTGPVSFMENGSVSFRSVDLAENVSEIATYQVTNIDKTPPEKPITAADITAPTNGDVLVTATFGKDSVICEYSLDSIYWGSYVGGVLFASNRTAYFRSIDAAGNISEVANYTVTNIDRTAPAKPSVSVDVTTPTNRSVSVSASFDEDAFTKEYSLDGEEWHPYTKTLLLLKNETVSFRGTDEAGNVSEVASLEVNNIDTVAPSDPAGLLAVVSDQTVVLVWDVSTDDFGVKEYVVTYSSGEEEFSARTSGTSYVLKGIAAGTWNWSIQAVDFAGNESVVTSGESFTVSGFKPYTVEYSADNFEHVIRFTVTTPKLDSFRMPTGTYQLRVMQAGSSEWQTGDSIEAAETDNAPQLIKSDADGNADVFFANSIGTWESGYLAQHVGSINDWSGTNEYATVFGKNKLADVIEGSTDANILLMTDDDNGDTLFVDDIYTALPGSVSEQQSRIAQIDEIRAGAGADIVDMTSQRFEYIGDGLTIRGGAGNDTIWANKGDNRLFGDAGNDRIVGASGNDVIVGGIGNDRMHGGGGSDTFTFCENWGIDTVEQLAAGSVTLWFASGSMENWDKTTLTYSDGTNSVKVSGVTVEQVKLKFGDDGSDQFATLSGMGAFFDATTERIFEESGKGILANL